MSSHPSFPFFRKLMNAKYFRSHPSFVLLYRAKCSVTSRASFLGVRTALYFSPSSSRMSTAVSFFVLLGVRIAERLSMPPRRSSTRNTPYSVQMSVPFTSTSPPNISAMSFHF